MNINFLENFTEVNNWLPPETSREKDGGIGSKSWIFFTLLF